MLWYATLQAVKSSLDVKETARNDAQVARALESACRTAEGELGRVFYPQKATWTFTAPTGSSLYVDAEVHADLVELETLTVGGTAVDPAGYTLLPLDGPPHNEIAFANRPAGTGRPIAITGLWGYDNVTEAAGTLTAAVGTTTATTVDVTNGAGTGVGSLLLVGSERMVVTDVAMLDTGQNLQTALAANVAARVLDVGDATQLHVGEVILVDEERMLVVDVAGDQVVVRRAWDGSVLAAHNLGADVYALRRLTVERGVLGTTAATHLQGAAVRRQVYPGPVVGYVVALAQAALLQEVTGQQQAPGGHTFGTVLDAARERAMAACGRGSGFA